MTEVSPLNIHDLYAFKSAVKNGSLSKAALELNYAQSNITMKIQSLENLYGTKLFYRHNRGITLTAKGEILFEQVNKMIQLYEDTMKMMKESEKAMGSLRIGSMETTAALHLPSLLTKFHHENSDVDIIVSTGPSEESIKRVEEYELDGAFVAELVLVTSLEHPKVQFLKDLQATTFICFRTGCFYRALLEQWLRTDGIVPRKMMEFGTLDGLVGCVAAGLGATLLPLSTVKKQAKFQPIQSHTILDKQSKVPTIFIYRKDAYNSMALRNFLKIVEEFEG